MSNRHFVSINLDAFKDYNRKTIREVYRGLRDRGLAAHQARWAITLMLIATLPHGSWDSDIRYNDVINKVRETQDG